MNFVELDEHTARSVKKGDAVLVMGSVLDVKDALGVQVEFVSRNDQFNAWFLHEQVTALVVVDAPDEPADDTWLVGENDDVISGGVNVYHRHDAGAPDEPERRFPRRWQIAGTGEWVDWPTAYSRGANPSRRLQTVRPSWDDPLPDQVERELR